jgi:hypothetical protein
MSVPASDLRRAAVILFPSALAILVSGWVMFSAYRAYWAGECSLGLP